MQASTEEELVADFSPIAMVLAFSVSPVPPIKEAFLIKVTEVALAVIEVLIGWGSGFATDPRMFSWVTDPFCNSNPGFPQGCLQPPSAPLLFNGDNIGPVKTDHGGDRPKPY
ncbi:unnamed protein product [Gongylonema pulchrum]|uniref:Uncharacterized protein n=1 Tax=Gongylonema pulchrum TaxID=637853 RepID=A0A183CUR9_9BILA|nr:unnamed protein product [Gongylonema pulchrum]